MKLLLSSLLLASLCAISSWSVPSGATVVIQTPDFSVTEGETVNITCCYKGTYQEMRFSWLINLTNGVSSNIQNYEEKELDNCSILTFSTITRENSGRYICKATVVIPYYESVVGNGTIITVLARENTGDNTHVGELPDHPTPVAMTVTTAVMVPLLLITFACFCALRRRQAQVARVIYEVPHVDSEVAEMDKHSTSSSRGSSQWCQVPVYESCDYFERVQTKESG